MGRGHALRQGSHLRAGRRPAGTAACPSAARPTCRAAAPTAATAATAATSCCSATTPCATCSRSSAARTSAPTRAPRRGRPAPRRRRARTSSSACRRARRSPPRTARCTTSTTPGPARRRRPRRQRRARQQALRGLHPPGAALRRARPAGQEGWLDLRLKLLADVGLVGLPNAGKSSLLARLTRAAPKVAGYPFTTLEPVLGTLEGEDRQLVVADIPGLIEGASQGAGLGHEFLAHVERTRLLVHVLDLAPLDGSDPEANFATVERELAEHDARLAGPAADPRAVQGRPRAAPRRRRRPPPPGARALGEAVPVVVTSAATGQGLDELRGRAAAPRAAAGAGRPRPRTTWPSTASSARPRGAASRWSAWARAPSA